MPAATVILTTVPVFLLIFLGTALRRGHLLREAFWAGADRLIFYVLFPSLLITTLAEADFGSLDLPGMGIAIAVPIVAMTAALLVLKGAARLTGPAFTSFVQGAIRQNTYIGLAVAGSLFGTTGVAAAAVAIGAIVPLANLICVVLLARYGKGARPGLAGLAKTVAGNPLILACVLGALLNASGIGLPPVLGPLLKILGAGALPLGLLAVGAGLTLSALERGNRLPLAATVILKLSVMPAATALACQLLDLTGTAAAIAILFNGLPTAPTSYILARQLGGDGVLMAGIITAQTACAMLSLPILLNLLPGPL